MRLATDTGGTFTDLVVEDDDGSITLYKAATVPSDPVAGVLDAMHLGRDAVFVATKIDQSVHPFVAAAPMPGRDAALVVAPAGAVLGDHQILFRLGAFGQLGKIADRRAAAAGGGRFVSSNAHGYLLSGNRLTFSLTFRNFQLAFFCSAEERGRSAGSNAHAD